MAPRVCAKWMGDCGAQALPQLQAKLRIERARMRLRLLAPLGAKAELERLLAAQGATIEYQDLGLNGQQVRSRQECTPAGVLGRSTRLLCRAPQSCVMNAFAKGGCRIAGQQWAPTCFHARCLVGLYVSSLPWLHSSTLAY